MIYHDILVYFIINAPENFKRKPNQKESPAQIQLNIGSLYLKKVFKL